jgi:hypothetical protein
MADDSKGSKLSVLDTVLVSAAVIAGIFVVLWIVSAVVGTLLWIFKIAVLVVLVAVVVRVVHFFTRSRD